MLVQDVMTPHPVTVRVSASVKEALSLLAKYGVTSLPVVNSAGKISGVVSEADLIRETVARDPRLQEIPYEAEPVHTARTVEEVFTPMPVTIRAHDDLSRAIELMTTTSVKSLPVVDERDRVVGMVSRSDVVKLLARADSVIEGEVDELMRSLGHGDWLVEVNDGVVEVTGPADRSERSLAQLAANTVPGVVEVRVS